MKVLVTCPPMLGMIEEFTSIFALHGVELTAAKVIQTLSEDELCQILPEYDGWIIGDDPATRRVFEAGKAGKLKAAVKWGIGVDNVDFAACKDLGIPITNCPNMFGAEVADVAISYMLSLARETYVIDRGVRDGRWPKPKGMSLTGKTLALIGYGDIGKHVAKRALACDMNIVAYDPAFGAENNTEGMEFKAWPEKIGAADFLIFTCALNAKNQHMLNAEVLAQCKDGVQVINVARGPLIDEQALIDAMEAKKVRAAALDVFEVEPLPMDSKLRQWPDRTIFGSHNGSNTVDGVIRCSLFAIDKLFDFLSIKRV